MRIGIITELFSPSIGGQEIRFAELSQVLVSRGHAVDIYCIGHQRGLPRTERIGGAVVHRGPYDPAYTRPFIRALKRAPWTVVRYALWARRAVRGTDFDLLIYNQWPYLHILLARCAARRTAVIDWCEVRGGWPYRLAQSLLPPRVALNMAVSPSVQGSIAKQSGQDVAYMPSGIHCSRYRHKPKAERDSILYLGRIIEHKNLPLLVDAFGILRAGGYAGTLRIAGSGDDMGALEAHVSKSPDCDRIELLGHVDEERKVELLAGSEVLVIPSRREGFPRVVAEAMASGLPVVTAGFPDNGTAAVVRRYGCGIVTATTALALADGISRLLSEWAEYSVRCLHRAPELDWSALCSVIEDLAGHVRDPMMIDRFEMASRGKGT